MTDAPREIIEAARKVAFKHGGYAHGTIGHFELVRAIEEALLARDQRAAEIIEQVKKHHYINPRIALTVAAKTILTYDTPTEQEDKPCPNIPEIKRTEETRTEPRKDINGNIISWPEEADYFMAFDPDNPDIPTD